MDCVLLNSVQSEANHGETGVIAGDRERTDPAASDRGRFLGSRPSIPKRPAESDKPEVPHRLADAILRDSILADGTRFSKSEYASRWSRANLWNATAIYEICPTALAFGMWGSPEKPGGLGAKFERAYISEIVAVDALVVDQRSGFRVDPISASSKVPVIAKADGSFELAGEKAKNALRPSELNHGNIVFENNNGGVRCRFAEQTTVISLGALRKLRVPTGRQERSETRRCGAHRSGCNLSLRRRAGERTRDQPSIPV